MSLKHLHPFAQTRTQRLHLSQKRIETNVLIWTARTESHSCVRVIVLAASVLQDQLTTARDRLEDRAAFRGAAQLSLSPNSDERHPIVGMRTALGHIAEGRPKQAENRPCRSRERSPLLPGFKKRERFDINWVYSRRRPSHRTPAWWNPP